MDERYITVEPSPVLSCATCGRLLLDDPEDEPDGDAGLPICGECDRNRDFDEILAMREFDEWGRPRDGDDR